MCLRANPIFSWKCSFTFSLELRNLLLFLLPFKIILFILVSLHFHIHFRISLPNPPKKPVWGSWFSMNWACKSNWIIIWIITLSYLPILCEFCELFSWQVFVIFFSSTVIYNNHLFWYSVPQIPGFFPHPNSICWLHNKVTPFCSAWVPFCTRNGKLPPGPMLRWLWYTFWLFILSHWSSPVSWINKGQMKNVQFFYILNSHISRNFTPFILFL